MKNVGLLLALLFFLGCAACGGDEEQKPAPVFKSSIPQSDAVDVELSTEISVVFDEVVTLADNHGITLNNVAANVTASFTKLLITADLESETTYEIVIPKGAVVNTFGVSSEEEVRISFTTKETIDISGDAGMQFVASMGTGWNLGNTLDAKGDDETVWGNPRATKGLIDAIRAKGFKTLRVPVTWQYHMGDAPDYTIETAWLDRVEEVVNYGLDNQMKVIVNIHHDEEWLIPTYAELDRAKDQVAKVWSQIATRFKDYDNNLIFETLNETRLKGSAAEWSGGTAEGRDCINQFHQAAVEAIRATGSENANRYIMISTYAAASIDVAINGLVLPSSENLIVSVHNYFPYELCLGENGTTWGTDAEKQALENEFERVYQKFVVNGIPVVMGEWGNLNHNNLDYRILHATHFVRGCLSRGICPVWWDNGQDQEFGIIDRTTYDWVFPGIADAIIAEQNAVN